MPRAERGASKICDVEGPRRHTVSEILKAMSREAKFLSMVSRPQARAVRRGAVDGPRVVAQSPMSFESESFGEGNPLRSSAIRWEAPSSKVSVRRSESVFPSEEEHDPEAPVSVVRGSHGHSVRVNDGSVVRVSGLEIPRRRVDLRGWTPAAHGTSPEIAEQVAELVRSGRHGLLASEHGSSGAGVYAFTDEYGGRGSSARAARGSYGDGTVIEGVALLGRSAFDDPIARAAAARRGTPIEQHRAVREAMLARGVGHVPDRNGGAALLHPSQFRVTAIHTENGTETFDPSEQSFRPGDPVFAPKTYGK